MPPMAARQRTCRQVRDAPTGDMAPLITPVTLPFACPPRISLHVFRPTQRGQIPEIGDAQTLQVEHPDVSSPIADEAGVLERVGHHRHARSPHAQHLA